MKEAVGLLNVDKVAQLLDLKVVTIRKMIYSGKLPYVKLGKSVRIKVEDINTLINRGYRSVNT